VSDLDRTIDVPAATAYVIKSCPTLRVTHTASRYLVRPSRGHRSDLCVLYTYRDHMRLEVPGVSGARTQLARRRQGVQDRLWNRVRLLGSLEITERIDPLVEALVDAERFLQGDDLDASGWRLRSAVTVSPGGLPGLGRR